MVNDQVGVNGRKIDLIALDDRYIPAKTVEATRRLVEPGQVLPMFGQLGTPTNIAVWQYLNAHHIPQLLVTTGSNSLINPERYPCTMGFAVSYALESWVRKYASQPDQASDAAAPGGYLSAKVLVGLLRRCGDMLTRINVMKQATSIKDMSLPLLLPGIILSTSRSDYFPMHQAMLKRFNGTRRVQVGERISE